MAQTQKEIKARYFAKKLLEAPTITCACGCGEKMKAVDNYARPRIYLSGHNTPTKYEDPTQFKREWNHRNRKSRQEYKGRYHRSRRRKMIEAFGGQCLRCGLLYDRTNGALFHFHHRDPSTKKFSVGNQMVNLAWKTLMEEASKCDLICANCHELQHSTPY